MTIKWNANFFGVEIQTDDMHFVVDANPSYAMSWHDAVRFYKDPHRSHTWQMPTREQLKLIAEHIDEVNTLIRANGGYEIIGLHRTADEARVSFARGLSLWAMATPTTSIRSTATMCVLSPL